MIRGFFRAEAGRSRPFVSALLEVPSRIPSLLGRDLLSYFALFIEERSHRVLLREPDEADAVVLP